MKTYIKAFIEVYQRQTKEIPIYLVNSNYLKDLVALTHRDFGFDNRLMDRMITKPYFRGKMKQI